MKYPISKEFFPLSYLKPRINERILKMLVPHIKTPRHVFKNKELYVSRHNIESYDGENIECLLMSPKALGENAPCLIYIHGGGFILPALDFQYKNAMTYAKEAGCKVVFVNYRLAPQNPPHVFFEDCYTAMCWTYENAKAFGIDSSRIGIGGESAGATLSVGLCMKSMEKEHPIKFLFQMLPYPYLDTRNNSESFKRFTDTPVWNSTMSRRIESMIRFDKDRSDFCYSPVEAECFDGLPPAYIETAEFDSLHDDGILYAEKLRNAGVDVTLNETKGTMHGFDIMQKAPTTIAAVKARVEYMKSFFTDDK